MNIVLFEPEIPANTGNIARTCVLTETSLHLIKPLGFSLAEKHLKRAGLDYWDLLDLHVYENYADFKEKNPQARVYAFTSKAETYFADVSYPEDSFLLFGRETSGLPAEIRGQADQTVRIPMSANDRCRCLNLSNAAAVAVYEALRQHQYCGMC